MKGKKNDLKTVALLSLYVVILYLLFFVVVAMSGCGCKVGSDIKVK